MSGSFNQALERVIEGDPEALLGFGLERHTTAGLRYPSGIFQWEERLAARGDGTAELLSRRSIAEVSGEEIGLYRQGLELDRASKLASLVRDTDLLGQPLFRVEPGDVGVRITVVAEGAVGEKNIGVRDPAALEPIQPLLAELDRLAMEIRHSPAMTLRLELDVPAEARPGQIEMPVVVRFINSGPQGYWVRHPRLLASLDRTETARLFFGSADRAGPDITPLPTEMHGAPLISTNSVDSDMLWVPANGVAEHHATAKVLFRDYGTYLLRAMWASYEGEETVAGQPRLRGAAYSNEISVEVK